MVALDYSLDADHVITEIFEETNLRCDTCSKADISVSQCEVCYDYNCCVNCEVSGESPETPGDSLDTVTMCPNCATEVVSNCIDGDFKLWSCGWKLDVGREDYTRILDNENDVWRFDLLPEDCQDWFAQLIYAVRENVEEISEEAVANLKHWHKFMIDNSGFGRYVVDLDRLLYCPWNPEQ